jgi:hypothetical protein
MTNDNLTFVGGLQSMRSRQPRQPRQSGVTVPLLADERSTVREEMVRLMLRMNRFLGRCGCVEGLLSIEQDLICRNWILCVEPKGPRPNWTAT